MNETKKAVGYVCDIPVTGTHMYIGKEDQKARLIKYAKKEQIELVHIFEDKECTGDFMNRPGVQKLLKRANQYDAVLVERAWALTRKGKELNPFLKTIEDRGAELVATTYLWDYLHQMLRRRYGGRTEATGTEPRKNVHYYTPKMERTHAARLVA